MSLVFSCCFLSFPSPTIVLTDFRATLNATVYYAQIDENDQLNASVFKIRAIFSTTNNLEFIYMSITQANETDGLLEFDGGSENRIALKEENLVLGAGNGSHLFDTSINLVKDPATVLAERGYPINIDININLLVVYYPANTVSAMAKGLGCIQNSTGKITRNFGPLRNSNNCFTFQILAMEGVRMEALV